MAERTGIEWTDATWNPWHGCLKVSPGCKHCYMYAEKKAYGQDPRVVLRSKTKFRDPLHWSAPRRVFTCSWSDFFIEQADAWRPDAWDIIRATSHLTYQILTKRPERIATHLPPDWGNGWPNVWLGVSAEDQQRWDERLGPLALVPARVRFVSAEPLLEQIDVGNAFDAPTDDSPYGPIHWVIVGGESGPGARPCDVAWIRTLVRDSRGAGVAVFVKQLGAYVRTTNNDGVAGGDHDGGWPNRANGEDPRVEDMTPQGWQGDPVRIRLQDRKGGDPTEWPEDLRVREFPTVP